MRSRFLAAALAVACAFCVMGLAACGGGSPSASSSAAGASSSTSSAAESSASSAAETPATDEELIKADVESFIGTVVSEETLTASLKADESIAQYAENGFDVDAYAKNMAKIIKFEVTSVDVDGDKAVAHGALTIPDFGDAADEMVGDALEAKLASVDADSLTEDGQVALLMEVLTEVLTSPDFPTTTSEFDIDYAKKDGSWTMQDQPGVAQKLGAIGAGAMGE